MNDQAIQLLEKIATKLGVTATALWGALLQQAKVEVVFDILIVSLAWYVVMRMNKSKFVQELKKDEYGMYFVLKAVVICLGGILSLLILQDAATCLFNPDYFALHRIMTWK